MALKQCRECSGRVLFLHYNAEDNILRKYILIIQKPLYNKYKNMMVCIFSQSLYLNVLKPGIDHVVNFMVHFIKRT